MNKKIISIILSLIMTICTVIIPVSAYADNYYISGVDISEHNDNVNLSALKAQGYSFVMKDLDISITLTINFMRTFKTQLMQE